MDPLNLILLIIVMLIGWRLRSVLGTRNDDEKPSRRTDAYRLNRDAYENPPEQAKSSALAQEAMGSDEADRMRRRPRRRQSRCALVAAWLFSMILTLILTKPAFLTARRAPMK